MIKEIETYLTLKVEYTINPGSSGSFYEPKEYPFVEDLEVYVGDVKITNQLSDNVIQEIIQELEAEL